MPPDPGYGGAVLGLHMYTWAATTFLVVLVYCGVSLVFARELVPQGVHYRALSTATLWLLGLLIAANAVAVFALEGFHWVLPTTPPTTRCSNSGRRPAAPNIPG